MTPPPQTADEATISPITSATVISAGVKPTLLSSASSGAGDESPSTATLAGSSSEPLSSDAPEIKIDLDPAGLQFLLSSRYQNSTKLIQQEYRLSNEAVLFIADLDRLAMSGQLTLEAYLLALEDELTATTDLSDEQLDRLYAQLLADRFVPLGDRFKPTALEVARAEQLALPKTSYYRIYDKPLTYSGAANEVASMAGFALTGGSLRERLRDLVMSKAKGVRTHVQVKEMLARSIDFGGLGLDPATADVTLGAMNDVLQRARILSEDEYTDWLAEEARQKSTPTQTATTVSRLPSPVSPDDEEIALIQAKMPKAEPSTELDKAIEATMARVAFQPTDEYLAKRLRNVISSRLRDVRNALELKQLLTRDIKVGGLGVNTKQADEVAKQIEGAYGEFHENVSKEEKAKIDVELQEQKRKVEERRRQEAEEHAKWFEEKIRARKASEMQQSNAFGELRKVVAASGPTSPIQAKEQKIEEEKFGPLVSTEKGSHATFLLAAPAPQVKVSPVTIQLAQATASNRPKLDGVRYGGPQLVGLVGELRSISIAEFRRLAKNPEEAAKKIRQKIDTLSQESLEKRIEGVRAFQGSPLQAAYLALVGESFRSGQPVSVLAQEKRQASGDGLSPEEIGAIISLNSALHF